ncbi:MAG: UTP--glucose-1-phosphate uridylyltransferase [Spirochaetota bacterium]
MQNTADEAIAQKMRTENLSEELIGDFLSKVERVRQGEKGKVDWNHVHDLNPAEDEVSLEEIQEKYPAKKENLAKLAVIKLNGGLGTSMGLSQAKSLIPVKDNLSFLEIILKQIEYVRKKYSVEVPLILMDSFNTQKDCQALLAKVGFQQKLATSFLQNKVPRLLKDSYFPLSSDNPKDEWCPPGHGDIYLSLKETGILQSLLDQGYEYAFISNGDNLGATPEASILEYLLAQGLDFAMEMTPKTLADTKGGAIYRKTVDGKFLGLELLETAQVPTEFEHEFSGMGKFRTFSTNNLWVNLKTLQEKLSQGPLQLSLIVNPKNVAGKDVIQLETAMGSAIRSFQKTKGIIIPRTRFAPVKKCEDILIRRSDSYLLNEDYSLSVNPKRKELGLEENLVSLDSQFYKKIGDFEERFLIYPSLLECRSFKVVGEVIFDIIIKTKGDVIFENKTGKAQKVSSLQKTEFADETVHF